MTVTPYGSRDWQQASPAVAAALVNTSYNDPANATVSFGPLEIYGYEGLTVLWTPSTDQFLTLTLGQDSGVALVAGATRVFTCKAGANVQITLPVLLGRVAITVTTISGTAPCAGNLAVLGHGNGDSHAALAPVVNIVTGDAVTIAAGASSINQGLTVRDGYGFLNLTADQAPVDATIQALQQNNTVHYLGSVRVVTANVPVSIPYVCNGRALILTVKNGAAVPTVASFALGVSAL